MRILARISLGRCILLRGMFGAPFTYELRQGWEPHLRAMTVLRAERIARNPACEARFDHYMSRLRAYIAGNSSITRAELREELLSLTDT